MAVFEVGTGRIRSVAGSDPPVGPDGSVTVPSNVVWRIIAIRQAGATTAAVNHTTGVVVKDGSGNILGRYMHNVTFVGGATITYDAFGPYYPDNYGSDRYGIGIPEILYLLPGYAIGGFFVTSAVDDDWAAPQILLEEWILPQGTAT